MSNGPRAQPATTPAQAPPPGWRGCLRSTISGSPLKSNRPPSALAPALGMMTLFISLLLPLDGLAAPIIGDPGTAAGDPTTSGRDLGLSGGPPSVGVVVTCELEPDDTTTCAVSHGRASVCPTRIPGDDVERSYRRYDYLLIEGGCTLTTDYWRTHGPEGEAPFDDTWDQLSEGGEAQFFNASETYKQILADGAGDGFYYRLARAYIAAELNSINGAPLSDDVARAFEEATVLFLAADPKRPDSDTAARFEALAGVLEKYNAGAGEPGTCPPLAEPFSTAAIGETLEGLESLDAGTIVSVDQRYGRGAGVVTIQPDSEADQFLLPAEAFTVDRVRRAKFTIQLSDCVEVATGQQCSIAAGGQCSEPELTTAAFLNQERLMRLMVAVSEAAAEAEVAPAAGPAGPTASIAPALAGAGTTIGGTGSFPSAVLPAVTAGGGGGGFIIVPNVIGRTVAEARRMINDAQLSVGRVTINERRAMLDAVIGVAWADDPDSAIVMDQSPPAGAQASPGDPVDITAEFSVPIPEVASLLLFATGLAFVVLLMARRRNN